MVHLDSKNENDNNDDITITKPVMTIKVIIMRVIVRRYSEAVAQRCSVKKYFLRNFAKFTGKHLCQSLFFNKVADLRPEALLIKRLCQRCFPVNFSRFLRTPFLTEHIQRLLLDAIQFCSLMCVD